ncbi:MAG: sugar transferase, partial [Planctomycetota bacterium]
AALGIRLSSSGPALYRARRIGCGGREFVMFKFRTMHVAARPGSAITAASDSRVFPLGRVLRALKIDELPQLWNVVRGDMSLVGPRPEDPRIVRQHFGPLALETLTVRPGLASPGSLFNYTHGNALIDEQDPEGTYIRDLLPVKLALELVSVRRQSFPGDLLIILRTAVSIAWIGLGRKVFPEPPEMADARVLLRDSAALLVGDATSGQSSGLSGPDAGTVCTAPDNSAGG